MTPEHPAPQESNAARWWAAPVRARAGRAGSQSGPEQTARAGVQRPLPAERPACALLRRGLRAELPLSRHLLFRGQACPCAAFVPYLFAGWCDRDGTATNHRKEAPHAPRGCAPAPGTRAAARSCARGAQAPGPTAPAAAAAAWAPGCCLATPTLQRCRRRWPPAAAGAACPCQRLQRRRGRAARRPAGQSAARLGSPALAARWAPIEAVTVHIPRRATATPRRTG